MCVGRQVTHWNGLETQMHKTMEQSGDTGADLCRHNRDAMTYQRGKGQSF